MSDAAYTYKIENVVATATTEIEDKIDLNAIIRKFADAEYNPERFPGLVYRFKEPKATILLFSTGKMVITGLSKSTNADLAAQKMIDVLKQCGIKINSFTTKIQNIVASGDIKCKVDLNAATTIIENVMYEPEVFPGLIYRPVDPKVVFLIFSTGRVVCVGAKKEEDIESAMKKLFVHIRENNLVSESNEDDIEEMLMI